jgi:hypothetical protein
MVLNFQMNGSLITKVTKRWLARYCLFQENEKKIQINEKRENIYWEKSGSREIRILVSNQGTIIKDIKMQIVYCYEPG